MFWKLNFHSIFYRRRKTDWTWAAEESLLRGSSQKPFCSNLRLEDVCVALNKPPAWGRPVHAYLWQRCWAEVLPCAGSTAGPPGWQSPSSSGSWWWGGWWRPCPADWWWRPAAAASWPARRTQSSPSPAATSPRPGTSLCAELAAWRQHRQWRRGHDVRHDGCNQPEPALY